MTFYLLLVLLLYAYRLVRGILLSNLLNNLITARTARYIHNKKINYYFLFVQRIIMRNIMKVLIKLVNTFVFNLFECLFF